MKNVLTVLLVISWTITFSQRTIFGDLTTFEPGTEIGVPIELIVEGDVYATATTDSSGAYSFAVDTNDVAYGDVIVLNIAPTADSGLVGSVIMMYDEHFFAYTGIVNKRISFGGNATLTPAVIQSVIGDSLESSEGIIMRVGDKGDRKIMSFTNPSVKVTSWSSTSLVIDGMWSWGPVHFSSNIIVDSASNFMVYSDFISSGQGLDLHGTIFVMGTDTALIQVNDASEGSIVVFEGAHLKFQGYWPLDYCWVRPGGSVSQNGYSKDVDSLVIEAGGSYDIGGVNITSGTIHQKSGSNFYSNALEYCRVLVDDHFVDAEAHFYAPSVYNVKNSQMNGEFHRQEVCQMIVEETDSANLSGRFWTDHFITRGVKHLGFDSGAVVNVKGLLALIGDTVGGGRTYIGTQDGGMNKFRAQQNTSFNILDIELENSMLVGTDSIPFNPFQSEDLGGNEGWFSTPGECPDIPVHHYEDQVTSHSVVLKWVTNVIAGDYQIRGFASDVPSNMVTIVVPDGSGNEYRVTGLEPDTEYQWQVRPKCTGGTYATWGPLRSFRTRCSSPVSLEVTVNPNGTADFEVELEEPGTIEIAARYAASGAWRVIDVAFVTGTQFLFTSLSHFDHLLTNQWYEWKVKTLCTNNSFSRRGPAFYIPEPSNKAENAVLDILVLPNPAVNFITVRGGEVIGLEVRDNVGRLVTQGEGRSVDLRNVKTGSYHLLVKKRDGSKATRSFIKQ